MLSDKESHQTRNNLAFCQILSGEIDAGLQNLAEALKRNYEPLYELNKGIAEYLAGNIDLAKDNLKNALKELREHGDIFFTDASYALIVEPDKKTAKPYEDMLIEVAILINLWLMGDLTRGELETRITKLVPEKAQSLLTTFTERAGVSEPTMTANN
jgi:tetratricopeptide (TPR) repeat protein